MTFERTASFCHTVAPSIRRSWLALVGIATLSGAGQAMAADDSIYPDTYMKSHPQTQQAFETAIQPLTSQYRWLASYGTMTPVSRFEQDGLIYTVLTGCKPHDCSTERYIALVDLRSNVRGAVIRDSEGSAKTTPSTTLQWFGKVDDTTKTLILKALTNSQ